MYIQKLCISAVGIKAELERTAVSVKLGSNQTFKVLQLSVVEWLVNVGLTMKVGVVDRRIFYANTKLTCHSRTPASVE